MPKQQRIPVRFAAAKLAEGDQLIMDSLNLDQNEKEMLEHIVKQMETERGLDRAAAIAHMRFDFIEKVCDETVVKPKESKEQLTKYENRSDSYGKIYGYSMFYRYYGSGVLPDI